MPTAQKCRRLRYGVPEDFLSYRPLYSRQPRKVERYAMTSEDIRQIVDALEQLDWVVFAKSMMASHQKAPGEPDMGEDVTRPVPKLKLSPTAMEAMRPTAPGEDAGDFTFSNRKPPGRYGKPGEPERYSERHAHLSSAIETEPAGSPVRLDFMAARREAYAAEQANREERSSQVARYAKACHCSFDEAAARLGYTVGMPVG